jgi:hypothetical protein
MGGEWRVNRERALGKVVSAKLLSNRFGLRRFSAALVSGFLWTQSTSDPQEYEIGPDSGSGGTISGHHAPRDEGDLLSAQETHLRRDIALPERSK